VHRVSLGPLPADRVRTGSGYSLVERWCDPRTEATRRHRGRRLRYRGCFVLLAERLLRNPSRALGSGPQPCAAPPSAPQCSGIVSVGWNAAGLRPPPDPLTMDSSTPSDRASTLHRGDGCGVAARQHSARAPLAEVDARRRGQSRPGRARQPGPVQGPRGAARRWGRVSGRPRSLARARYVDAAADIVRRLRRRARRADPRWSLRCQARDAVRGSTFRVTDPDA